jgi:hypothetical protein
LKRIHLIVGVLGVVAFLLSGQVLKHHQPSMQSLPGEVRMMYVSRHIYVLAAALVNLVLGLYFQIQPPGLRRALQLFGSMLILLSILSSLLAFGVEPALGIAGRGWRSYSGLIALFAGVVAHTLGSLGRKPN